MTRDWTKVTDEMCDCGHLKSEHNGASHLGGAVVVPGHGSCKTCACGKFTWDYFVDADGKKV